MKTRHVSTTIILAICSISSTCARAQAGTTSDAASTANPQVRQAVAKLKQFHPDVRVEFSDKTGLPKSIINLYTSRLSDTPTKKTNLEDVDGIVGNFFVGNQQLFLQTAPLANIRITQRKLDPQLPDRAFATVQQTVKGIDVYGAEAHVSVNLNAAAIEKLSTSFVASPAQSTVPSVSEDDAKATANIAYMKDLASSKPLADGEIAIVGASPIAKTQLVFFDPSQFKLSDRPLRLTWLVKIGTFEYFVDAQDKTILHRFRDLPSVRNRLTYDTNGTNDLPGTLVLKENGAATSAALSNDATLAHAAAGRAYDYYFNTFKRDSYDNKPGGGSTIQSSVRYMTMQNALWDSRNERMLYGPGYASSPEIVGHEITHGVISTEVNLRYFGESGAANEAFADFFGVMIAASDLDHLNWKIGQSAPGYTVTDPLRDMANPHNGGFQADKDFGEDNRGQPDHYSDFLVGDPENVKRICASTTDSFVGCVHFNSGILNKAFYLATMGGAGPHGDTTVVGLGPLKMQQIFYRTLTGGKMTSVAQFKEVASSAKASCVDLSSANLFAISGNDCEHLADAFAAVGIVRP